MTELKTINLRHYGSNKFDLSLFKPIKNRHWIKPYGGLWTSPLNTKWGWKEWCEAENFNIYKIDKFFNVTFTGNILVIDSEKDLDKLKWKKHCSYVWHIDFEEMVNNGVDAIWLTQEGEADTRLLHPRSLYGWDCESVLIMNKEKIQC